MASMGTGMDEESSTATAPTPQNPILRIAGRITAFHLWRSCTKNCFKHGPLPAVGPSIQKDHCTVEARSPGVGNASAVRGFPRCKRDETIVGKDSKRIRRTLCAPRFMPD